MSTPQPSSASGGVKNLRAMFETKNPDPTSISPPSRGRSPAGSDASNINSSRPVSKVRASFVAVERPGEGQQQMWGLRKASDVSSMAEVKEEAEKEDTFARRPEKGSVQPEEKQNMSAGLGTKNGSELALVDSEDAPTPSRLPKDLSVEAKTNNENTRKPETGKPASARTQTASTSDKATEKVSSPRKPAQETKKTVDGSDQQKAKGKPKAISTGAGIASNKLETTSSPKPASGNTSSKSSNTPQHAKTPITPNRKQPVIRGGPKKAEAVTTSAQTAADERQSNSEALNKPTQPSPKNRVTTQTPAAMAKPSPTSPTVNGNKRLSSTTSSPKTTRPRSPTRPIRLPASATAATASSAAKTGGTRVSASPPTQTRPRSPTRPVRLPASATAPTASSVAKTGIARSPSRAGVSQASIARKPSTLRQNGSAPNKARNSTANLSKKTSRLSISSQNQDSERPKSRVSMGGRPRDEGFLARMMRPTASSVQKTHDKAEVNSPPRGKGKPASLAKGPPKSQSAIQPPKSPEMNSTTSKEPETAPLPTEETASSVTPHEPEISSPNVDTEESGNAAAVTEEAPDYATTSGADKAVDLGDSREDDLTTPTVEKSVDGALQADQPDSDFDADTDKNDTETGFPEASDVNTDVSTESKGPVESSIVEDEEVPIESNGFTEKHDKKMSGSTDVEVEASSATEKEDNFSHEATESTDEGSDELNRPMETF